MTSLDSETLANPAGSERRRSIEHKAGFSWNPQTSRLDYDNGKADLKEMETRTFGPIESKIFDFLWQKINKPVRLETLEKTFFPNQTFENSNTHPAKQAISRIITTLSGVKMRQAIELLRENHVYTLRLIGEKEQTQ